MAQIYNCAGADELSFFSTSPPPTKTEMSFFDVIYRTAEEVFIPLTVGGGKLTT
jgi:cyclase